VSRNDCHRAKPNHPNNPCRRNTAKQSLRDTRHGSTNTLTGAHLGKPVGQKTCDDSVKRTVFCHTPNGIIASMNRWQELDEHGEHTCEWCGARFNRKSYYGKAPRYCRASHRVRASERRRGLLRPRQRPARVTLPTAAFRHLLGQDDIPDQIARLEDQYDAGYLSASSFWAMRRGLPRSDYHLVRPGAAPGEDGRVPALCGTMVKPHYKPVVGLTSGASCLRCEGLVPLHPAEPHWWSTTTLLGAAAIVDDLRSTTLTVGQAIAGKRNPRKVLRRVEQELLAMHALLGRAQPLPPSLHPRSTGSG
jgi:hypothetical protein